MYITLNGFDFPIKNTPITVSDLFKQLKLSEKGRIVELNGKIIDAHTFCEAAICEGDIVEVIQFMGGGS